MAGKLLFYQAEANELCQELHSTMAGKAAQAGKAVECEGLGSFGKEPQERLLALGERHERAIVPIGLAPKGHLHGRGHDILIGNTHEGTQAIIIQASTHGKLLGAFDLGNHHTPTLDTMHAHVALHRGYAIERGSGLDHIDLFIAAHTGNLAIVLHTNEQPPAFGIGKSRQCTRNLARIGDLILEILLLMFALGDEVMNHGLN